MSLAFAAFCRWLLAGGWKWLLGGVAALAITIFVTSWLHNYHTMQDKAARTDKAEAQIRDFNSRLGAAVKAKGIADHDRDIARAQLAQADTDRDGLYASLRKGMNNAPVRTNPVCWPTDDQRRLRNTAATQLIPGFGTVGAGGGMPEGAH